MRLQLEHQTNRVADEVSALTAVVRPILRGTLFALKRDVADAAGGYEDLSLAMLSRLHRPGDGDCGICFEYAVHDAMNRRDPLLLERMVDALARCNVNGEEPSSILFGAEKTGALQLIDTARDVLTNDSTLLYGSRGRPVKLKRHIDGVALAFRRPAAREELPQSISGLWKADLFLGFTDSDYWVGSTVKVNRQYLEPARGLRVGVVPAREGRDDRIQLDQDRNLVVCPLPYDAAFMEVFYQAWGVVRQFMAADAELPREVNLPRPPERQVARYLEDRREYPVLDVIEALEPLAQPELITTETRDANVELRIEGEEETSTLINPIAQQDD